jgi:hypothetical protein
VEGAMKAKVKNEHSITNALLAIKKEEQEKAEKEKEAKTFSVDYKRLEQIQALGASSMIKEIVPNFRTEQYIVSISDKNAAVFQKKMKEKGLTVKYK